MQAGYQHHSNPVTFAAWDMFFLRLVMWLHDALINLSLPNISMQILHTVLYTFLMYLSGEFV